MRGYVYILTNPHMPGLVKIGRTTGEPEARASQLYQTGVPGPFKVNCSVLSPNCVELESIMHGYFSESRVRGEREFFSIAAHEAIAALDEQLREQVREFVSEYIDCYSLVPSDDEVCNGHLNFLAHQFGTNTAEVASAMSEMSAEELAPAMLRYRARIARRAVQVVNVDG